MTWEKWYSYDSAWAIFRRGIIVGGIGATISVFLEVFGGNSSSHFYWFPLVGVPVSLTLINLILYLVNRGQKSTDKDQQ